jgi:ubiquinone/menaquinone biosynthesis C-methylase UbiE
VERLRRFAAACPPGPVLEIGCGPAGHVGRYVADLGRSVIGVDVSEGSLHVARRLNPTLPFVAADMRTLPVRSDSSAGVLAFYSMIYEAADGVRTALAEFRRVVRRGGALLIAVHAGEGEQRFTDYKGIPVDITLHYRTPEAFAALVQQAAFTLQACEVRPPYAFEHATNRLYVAALAD